MIIAYVPFLIACVGLLLWIFASNAKLAEIGRILFICGVFVTTLSTMNKTTKLFSSVSSQAPAPTSPIGLA